MTDTDRIYQANYKLPSGDLINVYGSDANEFEAALSRVNNMAAVIAATGDALRGAGVAADVLGAAPAAVPSQQQPQASAQQYQQAAPQQQQQAAAPGGQPAPQCRHGARTLKSGTSKAGKDYSGWMCSSRDRQDQCEPIWNRG